MLRPFWKEENYTDEARALHYGSWVATVQITEIASQAQVAVLPMSWNYYVARGEQKQALDFIEHARGAGLRVLTWCSGDFGVTPLSKDVYVFRSSGYASRRLPNQHALPVFFDDPLAKLPHAQTPPWRTKGRKPVIGFCGQAYAPWYKNAFDVLRTATRNIKFYVGLSKQEPQQLFPATLRRKRALEALQQHPGIQCNFLIRQAYRAGARNMADKQRTTIEYIQNTLESDYVLCIRGNGNFSARLYETMALGRIPVIVNTDAIYPWDGELNWKEKFVWIESSQLTTIGEKIIDFHNRLSADQFRLLQEEIRELWYKKLSMSGFFSTLLNHL